MKKGRNCHLKVFVINMLSVSVSVITSQQCEEMDRVIVIELTQCAPVLVGGCVLVHLERSIMINYLYYRAAPVEMQAGDTHTVQ